MSQLLWQSVSVSKGEPEENFWLWFSKRNILCDVFYRVQRKFSFKNSVMKSLYLCVQTRPPSPLTFSLSPYLAHR